MRETARSVLLVFGLMSCAAFVVSTNRVDPTPAQNPDPVISEPHKPAGGVSDAVRDAYMREFGVRIERPALHIDPSGGGCGAPYLTTTACLRDSSASARVLHLFATPDGRTVVRKSQLSAVFVPAGTFRVLTVITRHPATVDDSTLGNWEAAQTRINRDHAGFAAARGFPRPIISFENTNVLADVGEIANPRSPVSVATAIERRGFAAASYHFVVSINLDPAQSQGGFAGAAGFVYMGHYGRWSRPLTAQQWVNVAGAVYHHEVGHHWGWPGSHDWAPTCHRPAVDQPFIVPATLFGWEDVDADGVPEILDANPYGGDDQGRATGPHTGTVDRRP
jgi:hypothetical protein